MKIRLTSTIVRAIISIGEYDSTQICLFGGEDVYIAKRDEIKHRRLESGLNKKELSLKAGLPANAIGRIEKGESEQTHPLRARAIAEALRCGVEDIFTETKGA